jgi:ribose transport system permease protein
MRLPTSEAGVSGPSAGEEGTQAAVLPSAAAGSAGVPEKHEERSRVSRLRRPAFMRIWVLTAALFVFSAVVEPGTLGSTALLSMLPFAAILALASAGQTVVIQQGGIDLSCAGVISLAAVLIVNVSHGTDSGLTVAVLAVAGMAVATGLFAGVVVTRLRITPLIATLAINAVLTGVVIQVTGGNIASAAPPALTSVVSYKLLGVQVVTLIPAVVVALMTLLLRRTAAGRRFEAIGAGPATARAMGMRVAAYQASAYVIAALCYAAAGILLAGFLSRPGLFSGDDYLLPTIAAVAIGGSALGGGRGSILAAAIGALFLTQLDQVVLASGLPTATQYLIQAVVLIAGIGLRGRAVLAGLAHRIRPRRPAGDAG